MMSTLREESQLSPHPDRGVFRFSQLTIATYLKLGAKPKPKPLPDMPLDSDIHLFSDVQDK